MFAFRSAACPILVTRRSTVNDDSSQFPFPKTQTKAGAAEADEVAAWSRFEELSRKISGLEHRLLRAEQEADSLREALDSAKRESAELAGARDELHQARLRDRAVADALFDGVCLYRHREIVDVNPALCRMFGYEREEAIGTQILDYFPEDQKEALAEAIQGEPARPYRLTARRKDGSTFRVEVTGERKPFSDPDLCLVILRDIESWCQAQDHLRTVQQTLESEVARRTAELRSTNEELKTTIQHKDSTTVHLRREQSLVRSLLDSSTFFIAFKDAKGRYVRINRALAEWMGVETPESVVGKTDEDFLAAPAAARARRDEELILETGDSQVNLLEHVRSRGKDLWLSKTLMPWRGSNGEVRGTMTIAHDVTALKTTEQALRESEARFRALAENSLDCIMRFDNQCRHLYVNAVVKDWTGIEPERFFGKTHAELGFSTDLARTCEEAIQSVFSSASVQRLQFELPNGIWVDSLFMPEVDENGRVRTVITSARNITDYRKALRQAEETESYLRSILVHIPDTVAELDAAGMIRFMNRHSEDYHDEELLNRSVFDIIPPEYADSVRDALNTALSGGVGECFVRLHGKHGDTSWNGRMVPLSLGRDDSRVLAIGTNMTDIQTAERDLLILKWAVEQSVNGIAVIDLDDRLIFGNRAWAEMHNADVAALAGRPMADFLALSNADGREGAEDAVDSLVREIDHRRADGSAFPTVTSDSIIRDEDGRPVARLSIARDISDDRRVMDDLQQALSKAHEADILKGRFLANMSHELRTPLNAIIGLTDVIGMQPDMTTEKRDHYLGIIKRSAQSLLAIMNNILKLSKIEAGKMSPEIVEFELRKFIKDLCVRYRSMASFKSLEFACSIAENAPDMVWTDPVMLELILNNLVGNAVKFTSRGNVGIDVAAIKRNGRVVELAFTVEDTGVGIEARHHAHVFDSFYQVDDPTTKAYQGTGLGLAITKEMVTLLGGVVDLHSEPGVGSRFRVQLPIEADRSASSQVATRDSTV